MDVPDCPVQGNQLDIFNSKAYKRQSLPSPSIISSGTWQIVADFSCKIMLC